MTRAEQDRTYPCDDLVPDPGDRLLRGVDVAAPADVVYRWVCQFRAAPYSYDWIDNLRPTQPPPAAAVVLGPGGRADVLADLHARVVRRRAST